MFCIDISNKQIAVVPIEGKTDSDMALAFVEWMNNMTGPSQIIMTSGEGTKECKLFEKKC